MVVLYWISTSDTNFDSASNWSTVNPSGGTFVTPASPPVSGDSAIFSSGRSPLGWVWGTAECDISQAINLSGIGLTAGSVVNVTQPVVIGFNLIESAGTINLTEGAVLKNNSDADMFAGTINGGNFQIGISKAGMIVRGRFNCLFDYYVSNNNAVVFQDSFIETFYSSAIAYSRFENVTINNVLLTNTTHNEQAFRILADSRLDITGNVDIARTQNFKVIYEDGSSLNFTGAQDQAIRWTMSVTSNVIGLDKPSGTVTLERFNATLKSVNLRDESEIDPRTVSTARIVNNEETGSALLDDICLAELVNNTGISVVAGKTVDLYAYTDTPDSVIQGVYPGTATVRANRLFESIEGDSDRINWAYWDSPIVDPPEIAIQSVTQTSIELLITESI